MLAALAILSSCGPKAVTSTPRIADDKPDGGAYTEKTVPVVTKVAPDGEVTLRFYKDLPDVAYISAADFQSIVLPGSTMVVTHTGVGEYTLANGDAKAVVNVNKDVFVSSDFDAFTNQMGLLQPGMANVYYDGMPFVRYKSITMTPAVSTVTLDFDAANGFTLEEKSVMPSHPAMYVNPDGTIDTIPGFAREYTRRGTFEVKGNDLILTTEDGTVHKLHNLSGRRVSDDLSYQKLMFEKAEKPD